MILKSFELPDSIKEDLKKLGPLTRRQVVYDFETTGLDPKDDRPIQAAVLVIETNGMVFMGSSFIKPHKPLSSFIVELTKITEEMLAEQGEEYEEVMKRVCEHLSLLPIGETPLRVKDPSTLIGHNHLNFDIKFVKEFAHGKYEYPKSLHCFDTAGQFKGELLRMKKRAGESWASYHEAVLSTRAPGVKFNLALACEFYGVEKLDAHRADSDVLMTFAVYLKQLLKMKS